MTVGNEINHIWLFDHICMNVNSRGQGGKGCDVYPRQITNCFILYSIHNIIYIFNLWKDLWNLQIKIMINWPIWRLTKRCMDRNKRPLYA